MVLCNLVNMRNKPPTTTTATRRRRAGKPRVDCLSYPDIGTLQLLIRKDDLGNPTVVTLTLEEARVFLRKLEQEVGPDGA
jgi:hypothetical protein